MKETLKKLREFYNELSKDYGVEVNEHLRKLLCFSTTKEMCRLLENYGIPEDYAKTLTKRYERI